MNFSKHFLKSAMVAIILVASLIAALEFYWRSKGYELSVNDSDPLWAMERRKVNEYAGRSTVFIGSSRIKFGIDIVTWEMLTGERAVQLALVGTSPRRVLFDLADDEKFAGKLVVDVMEPAFFPLDTVRGDMFAREALHYYHNETPAQRASEVINHALESNLLMLDEGKFGLNNLLKEYSQDNNRPGVIAPLIPFREDFTKSDARRQSSFTQLFLNSPDLIQQQIDHWEKNVMVFRKRARLPQGASLDSFCNVYKIAFDKIRSRGGQIVFVRLPSSGTHLASELKQFPRSRFYDHLLKTTNTYGIHYTDYPATANMVCTEDSHLNPEDAIKYTTSLVQILKNEFGWNFPTSKHP